MALLVAATLLLAGLIAGGVLAVRLVSPERAPDPTTPAIVVAPSDGADATAPARWPPPRDQGQARAGRRHRPSSRCRPAWALPDGWQYDLACDWESEDPPSACALHLYDEAGSEQPGWPVAIRGECYDGVAVGPQNSAFVACTRNGRAVLTGLDQGGTALPGWPVIVPGTVAYSTWNNFAWGGVDSAAVGPDGTVYMAVSPNDESGRYAIHAFAPDGAPRKGWPRELPGGAQGFTLAPDGTVVAWWYEGSPAGHDRPGGTANGVLDDRPGRPDAPRLAQGLHGNGVGAGRGA